MNPASIWDPAGEPWYPIPLAMTVCPRGARMAYAAIMKRSGRLEKLWNARTDSRRDRIIESFFAGPSRICIDASDRELAEAEGCGIRSIQQGLAWLSRKGWIERRRDRGKRTIRLRRPEGGGP
jgi:hypothetical protein